MYVYRFLNEDSEVIYVGLSKNLKVRIEGHDSLPKEAYENVDKIEYIKCKTEADMHIYEIYYINKYMPKYNKLLKYNKPSTLNINKNIKWKTYEGLKIGSNPSKHQIRQRRKENRPRLIICDNVPTEFEARLNNILILKKKEDKINQVEELISILDKDFEFDERFTIGIRVTHAYYKHHESYTDLRFGIGDKKQHVHNFYLYDGYDNYVPPLSEFYYIEFLEMYNILTMIINYYYNKDKFILKGFSKELCNPKETKLSAIVDNIITTDYYFYYY